MSNRVIIEPKVGRFGINLKELVEYRELIGILAWRDILAQYKQAIFGFAWAVLKPVFSIVVFTLVFGKVARLTTSGVPYPLFSLCGLVAWNFFVAALTQSTFSLLANTHLITKVYFPRIVLPIASLGRGAVDFSISLIILIAVMIIYGFTPQKTVVFFPLFLLMGLNITLGVGLFLSALSAKYHDIQHVIPFLAQMWFWLTPVAYGLENIPERLKLIFYLNPMTWIIQGFRWSILGVDEMDIQKILITLFFSVAVLLFGLFFFGRKESEFADII